MTASQRQPRNRHPAPSQGPSHPWASFFAGVVGAGLLLPTLLLLTPSAGAFTWSDPVVVESSIGTVLTTDTGAANMALTGSGRIVFGYYDGAGNDFSAAGTTNNFESSSLVNIATEDDVGLSNDLDAVGDTVVSCWYDATNDDLEFGRSTDGGVFWTRSVVDSAGDVGRGCQIVAASASTYFIAYEDKTVGAVNFARSADSGSTWTTVQVDTLTGALFDDRMGIAARNTTDLVILYTDQTGSPLIPCRSSDAGDTWTCEASIATGAVGTQVRHVVNATYFAFSGDEFYKTTDGGATWGGNTMGAGGGFTNEDMWVVSEDEVYVISSQQAEITSSGAALVALWSTTDSAASWDREVLFNTTDANSQSVRGAGLVVSDGELVVGYRWWRLNSWTAQVQTATIAAPALVLPTTSISVADINGISVDPQGSSIIIRTGNSPDTIRRLDAQSLVETNSVATGDCNRIAGVHASGTHLSFLDCIENDGGHAGTDEYVIRVRNKNLTTPTFPSGCTWCNEDFVIADQDSLSLGNNFDWDGNGDTQLPEDFDAFNMISLVNFVTPRFFVDTTSPDADYGWMTWSFDTGDGKVGHAMFTAVNNANEVVVDRNLAIEQYSGSRATHLCAKPSGDITTGSDPSAANEFIWAVRDVSTSIVYRVDYSQSSQFKFGAGGYRALEGTMVEFFTNPTMNNAVAVGCTNHAAVVVTDAGQAVGKNYTTPSGNLFSVSVATPVQRGAAFSGNGNFVAWLDGTTARVASASDGVVVAEMTIASGTQHDMFLDHVGANLWVRVDDVINRFDVSALTCVDACSITIGDGLPDVPEPGDDALFDTTDVADSLGTSVFGANLLFGALLIGLVSFGVGTGGGALGEGQGFRFSFPAAGIGALMGFLVAWGLGFFTDGTVFVIVVLSILILGAGVWFRR